MKADVANKEDITKLVSEFYTKVRQDHLLAAVFSHVDWDHHTPVIINFWASMLLGDQSYQGNPFQKHIGLPIRAEHFDRWLTLFYETVDENFVGATATEAKERARSIAGIFQHRLGLIANR